MVGIAKKIFDRMNKIHKTISFHSAHSVSFVGNSLVAAIGLARIIYGQAFSFLSLLFLLLSSSSFAIDATPKKYDYGFIAAHDRALDGSRRIKALGPIYEKQIAPDGKTFVAVRPFYSAINDPANQRRLNDYIWPVGMTKWNKQEKFSRFILFFSRNYNTKDPQHRQKFFLFPIMYSGKSVKGERYFAIFPIGGRICEFLNLDRINFVLFPLYMNHTVGKIKTHDILWPVISWTRGGDTSRFRVFPFYGKSVNGDRWTKRFIMWPIWTQVKYGYPGDEGGGFMLFPLFGRVKTVDQSEWLLIPPLFKYARSDKQLLVTCPYPFIQYASGKYNKLYVWPLFGRKESEGEKHYFALWPILNYITAERNKCAIKRFTLMPLVFYDRRIPLPSVPAMKEEEKERMDKTFLKVWPLFSYSRQNESSKTRVVDLWPGRNLPGLDRNLSPLWTVYSRISEGKSVEHELLWGLVRRDKREDGSGGFSLFPLVSWQNTKAGEDEFRWDFLKGLVGYKSDGLRKRVRLLYFMEFGSKGDGQK